MNMTVEEKDKMFVETLQNADAHCSIIEHLRLFANRPMSDEKEGLDDESNDVYEMGFEDGETFLARMILYVVDNPDTQQ